MKILYIECNMGAAGDMLMSALLELHPEPDKFMDRFNSLNIPNVRAERQALKKYGISGTHINITVNGVEENEHIHEHHHHHSDMRSIEHIVSHFDLKESIKSNILSVFNLIARAESTVHNCEIENIHFHEVGTMDAVADITGVCMLIDELGADKIIASPINVGKGFVKCVHGILPVPAPATALILSGVPIYNNNIRGELCTPTGAALLKHFVSEFKPMPVMNVDKIGYGFGTKDFEVLNCVRAFMSEETENNTVYELKCNVDDMTGEEIGFAVSKLFEVGARDVFTTPIYMKKNRPALLITCICDTENRDEIVKAIFKYTSTIGIRECVHGRYILDRCEETIDTKYGKIRLKKSEGYGVKKIKPEYNDIEKIASENNVSIKEVLKELSL